MKIALLGYGKMGRLVESAAKEKGHEIIAVIDPTFNQQTLTDQIARHADVCIDFTTPESVLSNVKACAKFGKNLVIGTTGWDQHKEQVENIILDSKIGCIYSPNFSIGVNLFIKIISYAAQLINDFNEYDVSGYESHHRQKLDSPSGTAKVLADAILNHFTRKKHCTYSSSPNKIDPDELYFSSIRCGSIPGTHVILFDSQADSITLSHEARNRDGFAKGAVAAAEWVNGKKGFYSMDDFIK